MSHNSIFQVERFSNFFLTNLGKTFLKVFYKAFLKKPAILLVIEDENGLGYHIYDFSFSVSEDGVEEIIFKIFSDGGVC